MSDKEEKSCCRREHLLLTLTTLSVILSVSCGVFLKTSNTPLTIKQKEALKFPGELFLRMLQLLVIPLMFASLVNSLANLDTRTAGKLATWGIGYYVVTIFLAVATGLALVLVIKPGSYSMIHDDQVEDKADICKGTGPSDAILDLIRNIFPDNIIEATFKSKKTCLKYIYMDSNGSRYITFDDYMNLTETLKERVEVKPFTQEGKGMNILGIIVFALFFGGTISRIGEHGKPLKDFFGAFEMVIMRLVTLAIWFAPIGIFCLITHAIVQMDDLGEEVKGLAMFVLTLMVGFGVHSLITLQIILIFVANRNPFKFTYQVMQALLTAFATASSNATMPVTLKCLEENVKTDKRITKFLIPLGATVNMNGTALYEAVAAIYIAQCIGIDLTFGKVLIICFTSVLASVGASGMPHAGMITMIMILIAIGLPPTYFALVVPVDWFIDRFRTAINVYDDMIACVIVEKYCQSSLRKIDHLDDITLTRKIDPIEHQLGVEMKEKLANGGPQNGAVVQTEVNVCDL